MKRNLILLLFLGGIFLLLVGFLLRQNKPKESLGPTQSGFSAALEEARKKEEERKKAEEEKKRQEEETKRFIETYGPCRNIPILMYHHIGQDTNWLFVKKETFAGQMDYLGQKGYTTVTLSELVASLGGGQPLSPKPVVLTFDDGYRDFYENAYPILRTHNFKATLFTISQHVGGSAYVTWDQLREMVGSGLVTVGDHTLSHPSLPILSEEKLKDEVISAKNILEEHLGVLVNVFSYPYGGSNGETEKILKENGFVAAVTTKRGLSCAKLPYELPRIRIGNTPLSNYGL